MQIAKSTPKRKKVPAKQMELFLFEVKEWEPSYLLGIDHDRFSSKAYSEYPGIVLKTACIYPKKYSGRLANFDFVGEEGFHHPEPLKRDPTWKPKCIGLLELPPSGGRFYAKLPNQSMAFLLLSFANKEFNFIQLWGPQLSRGSSLCTSVQFSKTVDLNEL